MMKKRPRPAGFDETLAVLRNHGFDVSPANGTDQAGSTKGAMLVSKHGAGAVLVAGPDGPEFAVRPGALVRGEVARLLDRGYQKFIETSHFELPATALQLEAIHSFTEELKELAG